MYVVTLCNNSLMISLYISAECSCAIISNHYIMLIIMAQLIIIAFQHVPIKKICTVQYCPCLKGSIKVTNSLHTITDCMLIPISPGALSPVATSDKQHLSCSPSGNCQQSPSQWNGSHSASQSVAMYNAHTHTHTHFCLCQQRRFYHLYLNGCHGDRVHRQISSTSKVILNE